MPVKLNMNQLSPAQAQMVREAAAEVVNIERAIMLMSADDKLAEAVAASGLKVTPQNIELAKTLVLAGFPVNAENLVMLNQAKSALTNDAAKALFFVANAIRPSSANVQVVNDYLAGNTQITRQLESLVSAASDLPEGPLKNQVMEILEKAVINISQATEEGLTQTPGGTNGEAITGGSLNNPKPELVEVRPLLLDSAENAQNNPESVPKGAETNQRSEQTQTSTSAGNQTSQTIAREGEAVTGQQGLATTQPLATNQPQGKGPETPINTHPNSSNEETAAGTKSAELLQTSKTTESTGVQEMIRNGVLIKDSDSKADSPMKSIIKSLAVKPGDLKPKTLERVLRQIAETSSEIKQAVQRLAAQEPAAQKLLKSADDILSNMRFQNELKQSTYLQIPLIINEKPTQAELFVFNKKGQKRSPKSGGSALLALDMAYLGHLEVYIKRHDKNVSLQFRLDREDAEGVIRNNLSGLNNLLVESGFSLAQVDFKTVEEPFAITDSEPDWGRQEVKGANSLDLRA